MAGLGTGAAPFRAFLQHLAWLRLQGQEIGPVYYYFGSRHQSQEYLYGEEIEAFILDGVITRAGLAFSRDGPKKVYIQHKMLEDAEGLAKMLHSEDGVFYLCGPTWPVPDVYEALVGALVKYHGSDPVQAGEFLESLKEEERYVLEVRGVNLMMKWTSCLINCESTRCTNYTIVLDIQCSILIDTYSYGMESKLMYALSKSYSIHWYRVSCPNFVHKQESKGYIST